MRSEQAVVHFGRHRSEKGLGNILDEIESVCMWDRQFCRFVKIHATSDGIDPHRIACQEGWRHEQLFDFQANAVHHVFFGKLGEVIHSLEGMNGGRCDWIDESEEGFEDLCGFCNVDYGEVAVTSSGLRRLRDGEHVMENGRGGGKDDFMSMEILELS